MCFASTAGLLSTAIHTMRQRGGFIYTLTRQLPQDDNFADFSQLLDV